jgi:cysteinyl-tRNA synthetase
MSLSLQNTLSKQIEPLDISNDKTVNMFVCGPTVYDATHIGHAKTYIQMDVLARLIRHLGYDLFYLQNITDIDDKIIAKSQETGQTWQEISEKYFDEYLQDMALLNNISVDKYARATNYVDDIIRQIQVLIDKDHAYTTEDGIYFEIATFKDYGKLSGRTDIAENDAQSRIDQSENKRGWNDFCLWKFAKEGEFNWEATFGTGRPGWHIEDTAITEHFFGPQYDIHGGAIDLIFPHHEAELTQMESISGKTPFVKTWVHTGFLTADSKKMSKSLGNYHTISQLVDKGFTPMAVRMFVLQSHYRSSVDFSEDSLQSASNRLLAWRNAAALRHQLKAEGGPDEHNQLVEEFLTSLQDDLNTPRALSVVDKVFGQINDSISIDKRFEAFLHILDNVLGLDLLESTPDISPEQKDLIEKRETARGSQDWDTSDEIRDQLDAQGIELQDKHQKTIWAYKAN